MSKKDENLTVSKVYETLKSPTFLKDLYWDILSGIKEKSTYKLMRETAEKLINQKAEALDSLGDSEADNVFRKTIVAQICSMSYAIDTVYSKILYMKLEKACKSQVSNIIQELRNEGKIPDEIWCKLIAKSEDSEPQVSTENVKATNNSDKQEAETTNEPAKTNGKRKRKENEIEDDEKVNEGVKNCKDVMPNNTSNKKADLPKKKQRGRVQAFPRKIASEPVTSTPKKELTKENGLTVNASAKIAESNATDIAKKLQNKNEDSDAESDISVGHISMASVSSVHTSDLSSFDDQISLSSDDEVDEKKKRLSLKELQEKLSQNSSSSSRIFKKKLNGTKLRKSPPKEKASKVIESKDKENEKNTNEKVVETKEASTSETADSSAESVASEMLGEKGLPKRVRKPNSRYSSDNILCASVKVKERKKNPTDIKNASEKNSSDEFSTRKKKPRIEIDDVKEVPNETQKMDNEEKNTNADVKSPSKRCNSTDLHKPHSAVRSLTSRRTAPVTLYSTVA